MSNTEPTHYGLVVKFPDQTPSFVHGFEAGEIWAVMRSGAAAEIEKTTHIENRDVITRMAVAEGWEAEFKPTDVEGWEFCELRKMKKAPERQNPTGLRVIK